MPGTGTIDGNLETLVATMVDFYAQSFPVAVSVFASSELLSAHREAMAARGAGPHGPSLLLTRYLDQEVELGRLTGIDAEAVAQLLTGAALHEAFLATYAERPVRDAGELARRLIAQLRLTS